MNRLFLTALGVAAVVVIVFILIARAQAGAEKHCEDLTEMYGYQWDPVNHGCVAPTYVPPRLVVVPQWKIDAEMDKPDEDWPNPNDYKDPPDDPGGPCPFASC